MQWVERRFTFTVPAGATVALTGRTLDSGVHAAVFTVKSGAELVVDPATLPASSEPSSAQFSDVTDPTLSAIATSLRLAAAREPGTPDSAESQCPVAASPDQGPIIIDLDSTRCTVLRSGGAVQITLGDATLSLSLPAERNWLLVATADDGETPAIALVDITSGGHLTLAAATGAELARHIPEGNTELPALFDAMIPAAPTDDDP